MSKYTLTLIYTDGNTDTRTYSRKIDAEKAGRKSGQEWTVTSPKGVLVSEGKATLPEVRTVTPSLQSADTDNDITLDRVADAIERAQADTKAKPRKAAERIGTFDAADVESYKCVGACGETLPVRKFPTVTGTTRRVAECRTCRDARTKAAKAAK